MGAVLLKQCESKEELRKWIIAFLDFFPIHEQVSRYTTATPMDMIWQVYNGMDKEPYQPRRSIWIAARGKQKTASVAIIEILALLHFKRNVFHLACTEKQAARAKEWQNRFIGKPHIKEFFKGTNNSTVISCNHPDAPYPLTYEIAPAHLTRVQGPRSNLLVIDEVSTLKGEKIQSYKEAAYIPVPTNDGKPPLRLMITSRRGAYTVTEEEIADSEKTKTQVRFWTCLEGTKVCPEEKHGKEKIEVYSNIYSNTMLEPPAFADLPASDKDKYDKIEVFKGCLSCELKNVCRADLAKPRKTMKFMPTVDDLIQDFAASEYDIFLSQMMSLQPSSEGLVFPTYSGSVHKVNYNKMWLTFTGTVHTEDKSRPRMDLDVTEEEIVKRFHTDGVPCYAGIDWGVTADPSVALFAFITGDEKVFVMRTFYTRKDAQMFLQEVWDRFHSFYNVQKYFCDSSAPGNIKMMKRNWGFHVSEDDKKDRTIIEGIFQIRRLLRPSVGPPRLFFNDKECPDLHEEFTKYHHDIDSAGEIIDDSFEDKWNHGLDALRYMLSKTVAKGQGSIDFAPTPRQSQNIADKINFAPEMTEQQATNPTVMDILRQTGHLIIDNRDVADPSKKGNWDVDF